jgi:DNA-binding MarR family transcriptional regulator
MSLVPDIEPEIISMSVLSDARNLRHAAMSLSRQLRGARSEGALSSAQLSILGLLYRRGELTAGQIAAADRVQPQSVTRTLAALEENHLVHRRVDPDDRRRSWIRLTRAGAAALASDMAERDHWLAGRLEGLTPAERAVLELAAELMERLANPS